MNSSLNKILRCLYGIPLRWNASKIANKTILAASGKDKAVKWMRWFVLTAGMILLATGLMKILSAFGHAGILGLTDPIFGISFRYLMLLVGSLELIVSGICLCGRYPVSQCVVVAWLATCFLLYRFAFRFIDWSAPCPCLGTLTSAIPISPRAIDITSKCILVYLLVGSYLLLANIAVIYRKGM